MTSSMQASFSNLVGHTLRGYEFHELIGSGGFADVYRAFQPVVGREVAVKVVLPQYANNPDFIRRFEYEAQIVARLEHPFIVPLYDFWREPDSAVLVMRWLSGGSIADAIKQVSLSPERVSRYLDQIAPALDLAHRRGVVHRDLKPGNILLDQDDNAYLADFGIAKDLLNPPNITQTGAVVGSPSYFSPEQIQGTSVKPAADIYSLGIVIYEMLTGYPPFQADSIIGLIYKHINEPLPPLSNFRPDLSEKLNDVLKTATAKNPEERFPTTSAFAAVFRHEAIGTYVVTTELTARHETMVTDVPPDTVTIVEQPPAWSTTTPATLENPYKGLRAFQEDDSDDFFGRGALVEQLIYRMTEPEWGARFLAVIGPSGSGKSSVVRAGLIPVLRQGAIPGSDKWFIVDMLPSAHPYGELERALLRVAPTPISELAEQLRSDEGGLLRAVQHILPADKSELLLVVDQFEELFTLVSDESTRTAFLAMLLNAVTTPSSRLRVLITLRADFYDKPLLYQTFGELIKQRTEIVLPLGTQELQMAIVGPAQRVGLVVVPELVEAMIHDVGEQGGALPLLQYTLTELYERRQGNRMSLTTYLQSGGVMGALARRADELYLSLEQDEQSAARQLFLRLVTLGDGTEDTRRRVLATEVMSTPEQNRAVNKVIDTFARFRLLTLDHDSITRGPTIEVAHEALIRSWARFREWLSETREELKTHRRLTQAAAEWNYSNREESFLAMGARLERFHNWQNITSLRLSQEEQDYIEASLELRDRREAQEQKRREQELRTARLAQNFQRTAVLLGVVGVVAVIATIIAMAQASLARNEAAQAAATIMPIPATLTYAAQAVQDQEQRLTALRLASAAESSLQRLGSDPQTALLLGIRSLKLLHTIQAEEVVLKSLDELRRMRVVLTNETGILTAAYSPDGKQVAVGTFFQKLLVLDVASGKQVMNLEGHQQAVDFVEFSADGKRLLSTSRDHTIRLWDLVSGKELTKYTDDENDISSAVFSADETRIISVSSNGTIRFWDTATGFKLRQLAVSGIKCVNGNRCSNEVSLSPDGKQFATAGADGFVRLWATETGQLLFASKTPGNESTSPRFMPDGRATVVGTSNGLVLIYDTNTGKELRRITGSDSPINTVSVSSDGQFLLGGGVDGIIHVWQAASGRDVASLVGHGSQIWRTAFSPDGRWILSASDDGSVRQWDLNVQRQWVLKGHAREVYAVAFSPDGKLAATASNDFTVRLWDIQTGKTLRVLDGHGTDQRHQDSVVYVTFTRDGRNVFAASGEGRVIFWETVTGNAQRIFNLPDKQALTYSLLLPSDQVFLTAGEDNIVRAWDAKTLSQLQIFKGHENAIYSFAVTADSRTLLTVSKDHSIRVWDFATGAQLRQIPYPEDSNNEIAAEIDTVILSADNTYAFTSAKDNLIRQWNWQTGQLVKNFPGHTARVLKLALSPDGKLLASTSSDLTAIVWDIETAQILHRLGGFNSRVTYPAFSPNGKFVLVSSWDNLARLFYTDIRDLLAAACGSATHDFTDNERAVYGIAGEPTCPQFVISPTPILPLPTTTALPNLTLPAWTPIGLPTASPTPTLEPTLTAPSGLFVTFTPAR